MRYLKQLTLYYSGVLYPSDKNKFSEEALANRNRLDYVHKLIDTEIFQTLWKIHEYKGRKDPIPSTPPPPNHNDLEEGGLKGRGIGCDLEDGVLKSVPSTPPPLNHNQSVPSTPPTTSELVASSSSHDALEEEEETIIRLSQAHELFHGTSLSLEKKRCNIPLMYVAEIQNIKGKECCAPAKFRCGKYKIGYITTTKGDLPTWHPSRIRQTCPDVSISW